MKGVHGDQAYDRGAVRIGDDARMRGDVFGIDLGNDEGHIGIQTVRARIIHRDAALLARDRHETAGDIVLCGAEQDVDAIERGVGRFLDDERLSFEIDRLACAARRGEKLHRRKREVLLVQALQHLLTDDARGAEDSDVVRTH